MICIPSLSSYDHQLYNIYYMMDAPINDEKYLREPKERKHKGFDHFQRIYTNKLYMNNSIGRLLHHTVPCIHVTI